MRNSKLESATYRTARRIVISVIAATLVATGIVLVFTPGPAILMFWLALALLAAEFAWARRWLRTLKARAVDAVPGLLRDADDDESRDPDESRE